MNVQEALLSHMIRKSSPDLTLSLYTPSNISSHLMCIHFLLSSQETVLPFCLTAFSHITHGCFTSLFVAFALDRHMGECPHQLGADNYQGSSANCTAVLLLNNLKLSHVCAKNGGQYLSLTDQTMLNSDFR